jgi:hypothetical protein
MGSVEVKTARARAELLWQKHTREADARKPPPGQNGKPVSKQNDSGTMQRQRVFARYGWRPNTVPNTKGAAARRAQRSCVNEPG